MHFDDAVGRIVAALDETGKRRNTLLVVTSDNGGSTAENNDLQYPDDNCPNGKLTGNNKPFRGQKGNLYEGGIHVAAIAVWPEKLKPGNVSAPVQIVDWMPTFCALAGYRPERDLKWDGVDIGPLLTGEAPTPEPRTLYWVSTRERAVRHGDWKLIVAKDGAAQLFNLAADPSEVNDLAATEPDRVAELKRLLEQVGARDNDAKVAAAEK
jgi:arylsulfatase A-like enzyme